MDRVDRVIRRRATSRTRASGRFVLRLDPSLHEALQAAARAARLSLNELCVRKLSAPGVVAGDASEVVRFAAGIFGAELVAVAALGSWARGEAGQSSDVDVLVVVDERVEVTRELYRRWDAHPLLWEGRPVDAHFTHLPAPELTVTGIWAEAALDGIVLFERDFELSPRLARVRRDIAAGRIVRRFAHGQPYWAQVA